MARVIAVLLSAFTMVFLGITALSYRDESLDGAGLTGTNAEAYGLVSNVSSDATLTMANALPWLGIVVLLALIIVLLLLNR